MADFDAINWMQYMVYGALGILLICIIVSAVYWNTTPYKITYFKGEQACCSLDGRDNSHLVTYFKCKDSIYRTAIEYQRTNITCTS